MPSYVVAGLRLDVDLTIPELEATGTGAAPAWCVRRAERRIRLGGGPITELRTAAGARWGSIEVGAGTYRLVYGDHAAFEVDVAARRVDYAPGPSASGATVRHLLIDQVLPYLLVADGGLVLHASCVARDDAAIAFVGPTGAGKSSMAAAFVQGGWTLLADDLAVLVEDGARYLANPVYAGLRLWEDSAEHFTGAASTLPRVADYTDKRRWAVPAGAAPAAPLGAVPLVAVVALGSRPVAGQPDCRIGRLRGADAFAVVRDEGFRLDGTGADRREAELERFARLVERVPVHLVEYRRTYALLPEVQAAVVAAVGAR